jgi:hypothetical protein
VTGQKDKQDVELFFSEAPRLIFHKIKEALMPASMSLKYKQRLNRTLFCNPDRVNTFWDIESHALRPLIVRFNRFIYYSIIYSHVNGLSPITEQEMMQS